MQGITSKRLVLSLVATLALSSATLSAKDVYATVNGENITKDDIATAIRNPQVNFDQLPENTKKTVIDQLVEKKLLVKEAQKQGVENNKTFKDALERVKQDLGLEVWMQERFKKISVTDKEIKDFFEKNKNQFVTQELLKARHILVKTEKEAKDIIKKIDSSKNKLDEFSKQASEKSIDQTAKNGGSLGEFAANQMVPEFSKAATALKKGTYSKTPVKTQFGYHVIYLEDKKPSTKLEFDKVKDQIRQVVSQEKFKEDIKKVVDELKKDAKIVIK